MKQGHEYYDAEKVMIDLNAMYKEITGEEAKLTKENGYKAESKVHWPSNPSETLHVTLHGDTDGKGSFLNIDDHNHCVGVQIVYTGMPQFTTWPLDGELHLNDAHIAIFSLLSKVKSYSNLYTKYRTE
jgi:hypothetical protein